jgi:hypothetical protein
MAFPGWGSFGVMASDQAPAAQWPPQIGPQAQAPAGWKGVPYPLPGGPDLAKVGGALGGLAKMVPQGGQKPEPQFLQAPSFQMPKHRPIPLNPQLLGLLGGMGGMR